MFEAIILFEKVFWNVPREKVRGEVHVMLRTCGKTWKSLRCFLQFSELVKCGFCIHVMDSKLLVVSIKEHCCYLSTYSRVSRICTD